MTMMSLHHLSRSLLLLRRLPPRFSSLSSFSTTATTTTGISSGAAQQRPFRVLGVQQVAIGCATREPLTKLWEGIFGLHTHSSLRIESENVEEDILQLGKGPTSVEIDLMTPIDPEKAPKVHIPPLNHVGLWVDDLPKAVTWMEANGVRFTPGGIRKGAAGHNVIFIHPKGNDSHPISGNGVLIELVQAPPDVIASL